LGSKFGKRGTKNKNSDKKHDKTRMEDNIHIQNSQ